MYIENKMLTLIGMPWVHETTHTTVKSKLFISKEVTNTAKLLVLH